MVVLVQYNPEKVTAKGLIQEKSFEATENISLGLFLLKSMPNCIAMLDHIHVGAVNLRWLVG